jgi:hypothetical protein
MTMRHSGTVSLALAMCIAVSTMAAAQTVTRGQRSWTYATYLTKLKPLKRIYRGYPIGLNIRKAYWGLQLDRSKMRFRTWRKRVPATPDMSGTVTYGTAVNLDGDRDFEVMQCGWKAGVASSGHFVAVDFKAGKLASVKKLPIQGCSNIWALRRRGKKPLIVVMGLDEGKLPDPAQAPVRIYDPVAKKLIGTGISTSSHESVVIDLDKDGNQDIVACNWDSPGNGSILFLRNTGTGLQVKMLSPRAPCMALEVIDLAGDGHKSVLVTDLPPAVMDPALKVKPERNQVFNLDDDLNLTFAAQLPLPYFERPIFNGIPFLPGWDGNVGRSHDVQIARGDIDRDGREDAIMSSMIWNDPKPMAGFQILHNKNGRLVDETGARMFNQLFPRDATHNFTLQDVNGDGFPDIVAQGSGIPLDGRRGVDTTLTHADAIYINDGTGHFANVLGYQLGTPHWSAPWIFNLVAGRPHWTRIRQVPPNTIEIDVADYVQKLSSGPHLSDPAERGAPGFNEFYYLLHNPDAAASVRDGKDASGLAHYLRVGRAEGRAANAAVHGP